MTAAFDALLKGVAQSLNVPVFDVKGVLAVALVSLVCGLVGSLVVGNRMAFFSDAMAHCAFAGAALGMATVLFVGPPADPREESPYQWLIPVVMFAFGTAVGVGIAFFRERSGVTTDSVIGVFFALALGVAAILIPELSKRVKFDAEVFLFGSPMFATPEDLLLLLLLSGLTVAFLLARYNALVFASFSPSLARSRRVRVRLNNYLFIVLLALVVNLSIKAVGVLLINALLVVPAASAATTARNLRQLFALTLGISLGCGVGGYLVSSLAHLSVGGRELELRPSGTIIVLTVFCFFSLALVSGLRGRRTPAVADDR
jgi:zinc transport system permease protein